MLCCLVSVNVFAQITKNTTAKHTTLSRSHTIVKWYMDEGVFSVSVFKKDSCAPLKEYDEILSTEPHL